MTETRELGAILDRRRLDAGELADRAEVPLAEVRAVLAGAEPGEELLRRLAPALGFREVDLFVLAGRAVPEDLAPLDAEAARWTARLVSEAARLPGGQRRELLQVVRSFPQKDRTAVFAPRFPSPADGGPGGRLVRMLQYRNLGWMGMARTLALVTPTYLSASAYGLIGSGRAELTPRLVTDFAAVLGINATELAALSGVSLPEPPPSPLPEAEDVAALLWEARRLSATQAQQVSELAAVLRRNC
jgi:hypothetical protein